jgi:hypothetical protein
MRSYIADSDGNMGAHETGLELVAWMAVGQLHSEEADIDRVVAEAYRLGELDKRQRTR